MEKYKINSIFFIVIILILLVLTGVLIFFNINLSRQNKNLFKNNISQNSPVEKTNRESQNIQIGEQEAKIIEKTPQGLSGEIRSIEEENLIAKQYSNIDLDYRIKRNDIAIIVKLEKNPNFNKEKTLQIQQIIESKIGSESLFSKEKILASPDVPQEVKDYIQSPEAQSVLEEEIGWEDLKPGMRINVSTEKNGQKKITVFENTPNKPL